MRLQDALGALIAFAATAEEILKEAALAYVGFLWRAAIWLAAAFLLAVTVLMAVPEADRLQANWVYTAAVLVAGGSLLLFTVAAMPLLAATDRLRAIPEVQRWLGPTRHITVIAQSVALIIATLYLLPTAATPRLVPLLVIVGAMFAVWGGKNVGATLYRVVTTKLVLTIVVLTFGAYSERYLPATVDVLRTQVGGFDDWLAALLVSSQPLAIGPSVEEPLLRADGRVFPLRSAVGGGRVWYHRDDSGEYVFYTGFRVLPDGSRLDKADTDVEIAAIGTYLRRRLESIAAAQRDSIEAQEERRRRLLDSIAAAERDSTTAREDRSRQLAESLEADRRFRNRRLGESGATLWRTAEFFSDVVKELAANDSVLVHDSMTVRPLENQAVALRELVLVATQGQLRVPVGAVVRIIGQNAGSTLVSYRFGAQEFVGSVGDSSSLRRQTEAEVWYAVSTYQGESGFLPARHTRRR